MVRIPIREPKVSCICVTRNRVPMLKRALACFKMQTYLNREIIVLAEDDDFPTLQYLDRIHDENVVKVVINKNSDNNLGGLRNTAVRSATGDYIIQWDDDDWYDERRIFAQLKCLQENDKMSACVLSSWILYDCQTKRAYISAQRAWEGSVICRRISMPEYPNLERGEDFVLIRSLIAQNELCYLNDPDIYIYTIHGDNTWPRSHFEKNIIAYAQPLSPERTLEIIKSLTMDEGPN